MSMSPETLVKELRSVCGDNLRSVVLYGSQAAGDFVLKRSDYNILVVLTRLTTKELLALAEVSAWWTKGDNPAPLLFTWERLQQSGDVFPIELSDIKENNKVLFGEDPLQNVPISLANMRLELEHELKGKLIQLRERFLLTRGKPKEVNKLLIASLSTFLVLFRSALRLHGETSASKKMESLEALRKHIEFDDEIFRIVQGMKEGGKKTADPDPLELFERYLKAVEKIVDAIDGWIHTSAEEGVKPREELI